MENRKNIKHCPICKTTINPVEISKTMDKVFRGVNCNEHCGIIYNITSEAIDALRDEYYVFSGAGFMLNVKNQQKLIDKWKSMEDALYEKNKFASTEKLMITTDTLIEAGLIKK